MPILPKEILKVGTYHTPEGKVVVTPRRLRHWVKSFKAMKAAGLSVPAPWEHQDGARPVSEQDRQADRVKNNAGFLEDLWLAGDGTMWGNVEVPDPAEAKKVKDAVRYVSPELDPSFVDGDGREWRDVITHLALTFRPVFQRQKPFGTPRPRMSLGNRVWLSMEQLSMAKKTKQAPLADETLDADDLKAVEDLIAEEGGDAAAAATGDDDADGVKRLGRRCKKKMSTDEGDGGEDYVSHNLEQLKRMGVSLPEHCTADTFHRDLSIALHAANAAKDHLSEDASDEDEDLDDELEDEDKTDEAKREEPLMMSLSDAQSLKRQLKEQAEELAALRAEKRAVRVDAYERDGRCPPAKAKGLREAIRKARMSFGRKGGSVEAAVIDARLDEIASTPRGTFTPDKGKGGADRLSHGVKREAPKDDFDGTDAPITPDRARAAADEQLANSGYRFNGNGKG